MKTEDVKVVLEAIIATLEAARQHEEDAHIQLVHEDRHFEPLELILVGKVRGLSKAIVIVKDKLKGLEEKKKMKTSDTLEAVDKAIEAMMDQVATHSGIKWQNSYVVLAHILESYSERCLKLSEQEPKKEEP